MDPLVAERVARAVGMGRGHVDAIDLRCEIREANAKGPRQPKGRRGPDPHKVKRHADGRAASAFKIEVVRVLPFGDLRNKP